MKILILGASGMLGHKLLQRLSVRHEVVGTVRGSTAEAPSISGVQSDLLIGGVAATEADAIRRVVQGVQPEAVLNCIGIVKQIDEAKDAIQSISVNSLLPHQLSAICSEFDSRLIHFSTDCVFSGRAGPYKESDLPDPVDLYGRSKLLGEVVDAGCLTIRTSIVGRELKRGTGLIDWIMSKRGGKVRGYRRALYSGLTTEAMSDVVELLLEKHPEVDGIWQVSADPIDKCSLLEIVNRVYGLNIEIEPDETFFCDRRLDSTRFREATGWTPPTWQEMIENMYADPFL